MASRSRGRASTQRIVCLALVGAACSDGHDPEAGGSDGPAMDATSTSSSDGSTGAPTSAADSTSAADASSGSSDTTGASPPVLPSAGFWRWQSMAEVVDGCAIYPQSFDYGLTRISDVSEQQFSMEPWGGMVHACPLMGSAFTCEPLPLLTFPPPVETWTEFDGDFVAPESGSMAFRVGASCEGPACDMIAMDAGLEFPCESTALTQGSRLADVELADEGCAAEGSLLSSMTPEQAVVTFVNDSDADVQLYWLGFDGARVSYGVVAPGATQTQWTSLTHAWLVADGADACLRIYLPTTDAGVVTIQ